MVTVTYDGTNLRMYHNNNEHKLFGSIANIDNNDVVNEAKVNE